MPIPPLTIDGLLPPFLGTMPGLQFHLASPYEATVAEVVNRFATTPERKCILAGWLQYRQAMRAIGIRRGAQWLDGSFMEDKERLRGSPPDDLDLVFFFYRPSTHPTTPLFQALAAANQALFHQPTIKAAYHVHAFHVDMNSNPEDIVKLTTYYLGLFSHTRGSVWKGLIQVRQEDEQHDAALLAALQAAAPGVAP